MLKMKNIPFVPHPIPDRLETNIVPVQLGASSIKYNIF
jgi:hypothetical protein